VWLPATEPAALVTPLDDDHTQVFRATAGSED